MPDATDTYPLTRFAHGAGCGCKVAPQVLQRMLSGSVASVTDRRLLVGNESSDDAAAYDMGNGSAIICTTDFFTPIVDDAFDYGRCAAANAISDVYAMGGQPLLALAILGWPVELLPAELAAKVLDGARTICSAAGITLAGGHTIDSKEPLFGLAVTGTVQVENIKRNNTAKAGDLLYLTKPLGTGLLSTARKRALLEEEHYRVLIAQLCALNTIGASLGKIKAVNAMTDVTGFGLLGHLVEMTAGSGLSAEIEYSRLPKISGLETYLRLNTVPDATYRNWNAYQDKVKFDDDVNVMEAFTLLPDPQTNGGLLFSVAREGADEVTALLRTNGLQDYCEPVGVMVPATDKLIRVKK